MVLKKLKNGLAGLLVGVASLLPLTSSAFNSSIQVQNLIDQSGDYRYDYFEAQNRSPGTEGFDGSPYDKDYFIPAPWIGQWAPRVYSIIETHELQRERKATNSITPFNFFLSTYIGNNQNIQGKQENGIFVESNPINPGLDTNRHYVLQWEIYPQNMQNNAGFTNIVNVRDIVTNYNQTFILPSVTNLFVDKNSVDTNGFVDFGKGWLSVDWNSINSSAGSGGSNSLNGQLILPYNANTNVGVYADSGKAIDKIITTTTDNLGNRNVTTNCFSADTNFYNVVFNNLKGSNNVESIFRDAQSPVPQYTISSEVVENGNISPLEQTVEEFQDAPFNINASNGYYISSIKKDGESVFTNATDFALNSTNWVYNNVTNDGTVGATFSSTHTTAGIPKQWFYNAGITNQSDWNDSANHDGDDYSNLEEWLADTHPADSNSIPSRIFIYRNPTSLEISETSTNRNYTFESNTNLINGNWNYLTNFIGNGSNLNYNISEDSSNNKFYRYNVGLKE